MGAAIRVARRKYWLSIPHKCKPTAEQTGSEKGFQGVGWAGSCTFHVQSLCSRPRHTDPMMSALNCFAKIGFPALGLKNFPSKDG